MKRIFLFIGVFIFNTVALNQSVHAQNAKPDSVSNRSSAAAAEDLSDDWAALSRYSSENKQLLSSGQPSPKVVIYGSSIIEFWKKDMPEFFEDHTYLDRGISGQISPQLLIRFRQDVISLKPKAVIILAGSNDIAGNKGHVSNETIMNNIASMAELARLHGIKVILCQNLPVFDYPWRKGLQPAQKIIELNKLIVSYAKANSHTVVNYFTPLVDEKNGQKAALTKDGVHPNLEGYKLMAKATQAAVKQAL
jgi:lysophospholipase L1-like esterase